MKFYFPLITLLFLGMSLTARADDWRAYHHGIGYAPDGRGGDWVFFSSVADASRDVGDEDEWHEHIYVASWQAGQDMSAPRLFIRRHGAQEPVSVASTADGHIMIAAEDSGDTENDVDERMGVYDADLKPVSAYPQNVEEGGHSGHVAAAGNRFVVFYSHEWVDGGGVDDLGSGYGVYARIYDSNGHLQRAVDVAPRKREWWPILAGSPDRVLLVWQAFVKGQTYARLRAALLDPATGALTPVAAPDVDLKYYTYSVSYMPAIKRFLVAGTRESLPERGFAFLVDAAGQVTASLLCMPPTEREAGIAVDGNDASLPVADERIMRLLATETSLTLTGVARSPFNWAEEGSIGLPAGAEVTHWISLDRDGPQEADFPDAKFAAAMPQDLCR